MQKEFAEMLRQTATGKLLEQITVRDFNLGSTFPVIRNVTTNGVHIDDDNMIEVFITISISSIHGVVTQRVEHWTCDQQVVGSNPTWGKAA